MRWPLLLALAFLLGASASPPRLADADPLTATINVEDVERFAALMKQTEGKPTPEQLQRDYLDAGSVGIGVFTPDRIVDAIHLARAISKNTRAYATATERCLPWVKEMTGDLRSIYLGLHGALPEARLPQIYVVMGAGNSGGTAEPGTQVLGLEVLCRIAPTREAFRATMRHFFAHETVHSFQEDAGLKVNADQLLTPVLVEGAADFIARLITGEEPDLSRAAWALPRERELWQQFQSDVALTRTVKGSVTPGPNSPERAAVKRWIGNYNSAPPGWPGELGYWMGMRIWERRYAAASDKRAVLNEMLAVAEPRTVMEAGKYTAPSDRLCAYRRSNNERRKLVSSDVGASVRLCVNSRIRA